LIRFNKWLKSRFERFPSLRFQFVMAVFVALVLAGLGVLGIAKIGNDYINRLISEDVNSYQSDIRIAEEAVQQAVEVDQIGEYGMSLLIDDLNVSELVAYEFAYAEPDVPHEEFISGIDFLSEQGVVIENIYFSNEKGQYMLLVSSKRALDYQGILMIAVMVLYIGFFLGTFIFFVWRKERYLRVIAGDVDRLSTGDLDHRIRVRGRDEIAYVAKNINLMSEKLQEQINKERLSEETKYELIANVSHDLRTPLTSVTGFLSLIQDNPDMPKADKDQYIETALNKAMGLNQLVDQLFEYVTLSNTDEAFDTVPVDMKVYMEQILFEQQVMMEERGFETELHITKHSVSCQINPDRLHRLFDNVFSNVAKHGSHERPVIIETYIQGDNFTVVVDNLIADEDSLGIPDNVFNRYFTTDRNFNESGGLGLSIAKEIMVKHKGEISVSYREHHFIITMTLPIDNRLA